MLTEGRRVTVFGGSGFIGRYIVRRLAAEGWVVRVAVRDPVGAAFLKTAGNVGQVVPMRIDLAADNSVVEAAIAGADAVINLVGILHERGRYTFQAIHADARLAAGAGASRFVQISAIGADRNAPAAYARSKAEGEAGVRAAFPGATIFRPSIVFGPEDHFFNRFARMARYSPALPLIGGGVTRFQPVYVGDVAEAIIRALHDDHAPGQVYELGGPRIYTFRALMELMLAELRRHRGLIPLPFWMAELLGMVLQLLPVPPLTRDQVRLLRQDNVTTPGVPGLRELGITRTHPPDLSRHVQQGRPLRRQQGHLRPSSSPVLKLKCLTGLFFAA
jgi:NADH dehydrogenase